MQLRRFDNVQEFWQQTQDYLQQDEAGHNALLGIVQTLLHYPERYPESPYLAACISGDSQDTSPTAETILAIAMRTPPNNVLLSNAQDLDALKLIADDLQQDALPGVMGAVAEVEAFVQVWQRLTGQTAKLDVKTRIYQLTQVNSVAIANGYLRLATEGDRPLLMDWYTAFNHDLGFIADSDVERRVEIELQRQSTYLWIDGVPVSMAGGRPFSPKSARIAPVYTPPNFRRKGYATACVAALSQTLLDRGCESCYLFADLANPTSNSIYQQIGFHPVSDCHEYAFQ